MLIYVTALFNAAPLLIFQFLFTEGIIVTQNIPSSAKTNSEFIVELTINKGNTGGFAKLQQDLPQGFTAVEDKTDKASFSFNNQSVKFIWTSLPTDKEFKISYKVKVSADAIGDKTISGKFSYVANNVKESVDIAPSKISIITGEQATTEISSTNKIPVELRFADLNNNGKISTDEIVAAIDSFFTGDANLTIKKINALIDFFFEQ